MARRMKSTAEDVQRRIVKVEEMLVTRCLRRQTIERELAKKWGCARRTVRSYIQRALKGLQLPEKAEDRRELRLAQLEAILESAIEKNDLRHALVAVDRLCKLEGLYTVQIEGAVKVDARVHALLAGLNLTPQERSKRIAQLKAKAESAEPIRV